MSLLVSFQFAEALTSLFRKYFRNAVFFGGSGGGGKGSASVNPPLAPVISFPFFIFVRLKF